MRRRLHLAAFALLVGAVVVGLRLPIVGNTPRVPAAAVVKTTTGGLKPALPPRTDAGSGTADAVPACEGSWARELRELRARAAREPDAALALVADMTEKHERKIAAVEVCLAIAPDDPGKAMVAAWALEVGRFADEASELAAVEQLAARWAETDLVQVLNWAGALPADDEARRDRVVKGIAAAVSRSRPEAAARLVAEHIPAESAVQIDAAVQVLREWAGRDQAGALRWTALFPAGALRERGLDELAAVAPGSF